MIDIGRGFDSRQLHYKESDSMFDEYDSENEAMMEWLEESGAIEWDGMDDSGERVFKVNASVLREIYPELYYKMTSDITDTLENLYSMGLIDVTYNEDLEPLFSISEEGKRLMEKYGYGSGEDND